ncbi:MAG: hypothetical protein KKC19_03510 [Nanoarchaeota archaeon]|nr:hypothetical protein [Nanoarchaeota archaeon]
MEFEVDVSGEDLFSKDYSIVVAQRNGLTSEPYIFGYKFTEKVLRALRDRHLQGIYRYGFSQGQRANFKIRLYCITIYYIVQKIQKDHPKIFESGVYLTLCKDFEGRENDIRSNLKYFLRDTLKLEIKKMHFIRLDKGSNADRYAYLMRKDKKNLMKENYIKITSDDFEIFLRK